MGLKLFYKRKALQLSVVQNIYLNCSYARKDGINIVCFSSKD